MVGIEVGLAWLVNRGRVVVVDRASVEDWGSHLGYVGVEVPLGCLVGWGVLPQYLKV